MSNIYLCFVWHMHQPFYKNLATGEYRLPWTRLHALKDYYGMVKILDEFPGIHQTFNLVPSMAVQIQDYAKETAADPFLRVALTPAEELSEQDQEFLLTYAFYATHRLIDRFPRYRELYDAWMASGRVPSRARRMYGIHDLRDLQVLSQVAWFDEEYLEGDPEVVELARKGRGYSAADQRLVGAKQVEIIARVLPTYKQFAARGQIEISTTPFYHPILPLLCDTNVANVSHPYVPLPSRFSYPEDAREQLWRARRFMETELGHSPLGLWPSEGSVSDETLALAAELGYRWAATDNGVLARTLHRSATPDVNYRPYHWNQHGRDLFVIFRDHYLSDLIGFVYSKMGAAEAADHFLHHIRTNTEHCGDALVPIILDGENAWEHYDRNGRPFLRELYRRITEDPHMHALTVSEAIGRVPPGQLDHIFPGSWINANFDVWIGAEEDNRAWEYLLRARQTYDQYASSVPETDRALAHEELLIAEGSDWCWWYGPEHNSDNRPDFDQLYRDHLANIYRALGVRVPDELARPILKLAHHDFHEPPVSPIRACIDGEVSSYYEWMGAGHYRVDMRSGSMHGHTPVVRDLMYGSDGLRFYLRLDLMEGAEFTQIHLDTDKLCLPLMDNPDAEVARKKILEIGVPLSALEIHRGEIVRFQVTLMQDGLPIDMIPQQGFIEFSTADPTE
jgi:alpha-amylase/alpha-mannosidase (GH57 family)